jgi:uncharacterized protein
MAMNWSLEIPELHALTTRRELVRIPAELDVPLTPRVKALVDTAPFRRLASVSQLGLVSLVYPGAVHTRFEHCLGVYRLMLLFLQQLEQDAQAQQLLQAEHLNLAIAGALLHDIAHWPYCHPLEDLRLPGVPVHEDRAEQIICHGELAQVLREQWQIEPSTLARLLQDKPNTPAEQIICSLLSSPIDVDKMDYLTRDSLHCGVPYGRNFDQQRLIGSLCLNESQTGLGITEKGRTAAEMLVFARYVMFSEVYWHHTVRSATAMLQRAFFELRHELAESSLWELEDAPWQQRFTQASQAHPAEVLVSGLFGKQRVIYKRLAQYDILDQPELYKQLAGKPYPWLVEVARQFTSRISTRIGQQIPATEILFDAPPIEREIEFDLDVYFPKQQRYRRLGEISPVVRTLAREQFDDYVKRVRIYVHPRWRAELRSVTDLPALVLQAAQTVS